MINSEISDNFITGMVPALPDATIYGVHFKKYHRETEHHVNQQSPAKGTTQINSIP